MADAALHPSSRPPLTQRQKLAFVSSGGLLSVLVVVLVFLVWRRQTTDARPTLVDKEVEGAETGETHAA
jgi:hypothetical protein